MGNNRSNKGSFCGQQKPKKHRLPWLGAFAVLGYAAWLDYIGALP